MGEIHYARVPRESWRDALLRMRAGGIEIVATYAFWIHHEETQGAWDFTGRRDLRAFVEICGELRLPLVVRIGPWCHGEVRNGGLPDWLLDLGPALRTDDDRYIGCVRTLYERLSRQLSGLLWKDGGPVVGIQLENEYGGPAEHLLHLKRIACEFGLDVPLYTRTGWPDLATPMPAGHMLPLHGGYAEGFWDRTLDAMPGNYWREFCFNRARETSTIATDHFGVRANDTSDDIGGEEGVYPFLTCELGGGMMTSYHRRIRIDPRDVLAVAVCKLGSGSNLLGYYMYHGGQNPEGVTTLNETQATRFTNYNDLPVKTYDFQAPLGEFGQTRPHYHLLRRLHLATADFGASLASMPAVFSTQAVARKDDRDTLRWSVRSDGRSGFLFVNNYQRGQPMPAKPETTFAVALAAGDLVMPTEPFTVPADASFVWPFGLDLGGVTLAYATAQVVCHVDDGPTRYTFFAQTLGVPAEFAFDDNEVAIESHRGTLTVTGGRRIVSDVPVGTDAAITLRSPGEREHVLVLLDDAASLALWKGTIDGAERVVLSTADVLFDSPSRRFRTTGAGDVSVAIVPMPEALSGLTSTQAGVFRRVTLRPTASAAVAARVTVIRPPGPTRTIELGAAGVAAQPDDADFDEAAVWRIDFDYAATVGRKLLLRIRYRGDVARAYAGERLLTDNFYNGTAFDVGLWPYGEAVRDGVTIKILSLPPAAPIALDASAWPTGSNRSLGLKPEIESVEVIEERELTFAHAVERID